MTPQTRKVVKSKMAQHTKQPSLDLGNVFSKKKSSLPNLTCHSSKSCRFPNLASKNQLASEKKTQKKLVLSSFDSQYSIQQINQKYFNKNVAAK